MGERSGLSGIATGWAGLWLVGVASLGAGPASAQALPHLTGPDKYHITDAERAACQGDAVMLCSNAYPDEDKLLECMRLNHANLSSVCQPVFDAGMKRRHIPL